MSDLLITRQTTAEFKNVCEAVRQKLQNERPAGTNFFRQILRIFPVPVNCKVSFLSQDVLRQQYSDLITSCYVFKFRYPHRDGFTHGLFIRLNGFAPRGIFDSFANKLVKFMTDGQQFELKAVSPRVNKHLSLFDYLQSLFVLSRNLLVNYSCQQDAIPEDTSNTINHQALNKITRKMRKLTEAILDNIISMPTAYLTSRLFSVLSLELKEYREFMKFTTLNQFVIDVCQDAYKYALQTPEFKEDELQQLMDPLTRRSLVNKIITDQVTQRIQQLLQQTFAGHAFTHPSPCIGLTTSDICSRGVFDAILLDPRFFISMLMCARWFAKTCLQSSDSLTNNNAHLMLYGQSGAGKSLMLSIIGSNIPTYKYLTTGRFQNPDVLSSALIFIDEFDTMQLVSNQYKSLLDIKSSVKVDFKNLHPENISQDVPCLISTNDEVLTVLRSAPSRKYPLSQAPLNTNSVEAAIRRLYLVPFKLGQYDKIHGNISEHNSRYQQLSKYNERFFDESDKINRMFNFILGYALFQPNSIHFQLNQQMQHYVEQVIHDFRNTVFGLLYLSNKAKIDDMIIDLEKKMMIPEINDTEYQTHVTMAVSRLQHLTRKFLKRNIESTDCTEVLKDDTVSWPIRMYYILDHDNLLQRVQQRYLKNTDNLLNQDASRFIKDASHRPFTMDEVPAMDTYDELEVEELPPLQVQTERKEPSTEQINTESLPLTGQKRRYTIMERDQAADDRANFFRDPFDFGNDCDSDLDESMNVQLKRLKSRHKI